MSFVTTIESWLEGPSLIPFFTETDQSDPYCETHLCADASRGIIASFAFNWLLFFVSLALFSAFAFFRAFSWHDKIFWLSSAVSTVHAVIACYAVKEAYATNFFESKLLFTSWSPLLSNYVAFTVGYFWYDLALMHLPDSFWSKSFFLHHMMGAFAMPSIFVVHAGLFVVVCFLAFELSTPFVNARWMLDKIGLRNHGIYKINGVLMMAAFFTARLVPFQPVMFAVMWKSRDEFLALPLAMQLIIAGSWTASLCLNILWFGQMWRGAIKLFRPAAKSSPPNNEAAAKKAN